MQEINIEGISQDKVQFGTKTTFLSGKNKFSFFDSKRDGGKTKAQEQYEKYNFKVGDVVTAEVKEEDKTFTNDKGKTINYTQRTILYFEEVENLPTHRTAPKEDKFEAIMFKLDEILEAINSQEPKI